MQKLKRDEVRKKLLGMGLLIFTAHDLQQLFDTNKQNCQSFLSYNTQNNFLTRLRKGFYSFTENLPHDFVIANNIYTPSYVSLESALSFHQIIPETVYTITSVTTKKTQEFKIENKQFIYRSIKKTGFFGYRAYAVESGKVNIAVPEKALADYTYYQRINQKEWNDRIDISKINKKQLNSFLKKLGGNKLLKFWKENFKAKK
jgi:predicted transcriptional regulator of viral defense system